jgi:plasmid stability protein
MSDFLVRDISASTKRALRIQAAENGRSMNEEARSLIEMGTREKQTAAAGANKSNWVAHLIADLRAIGEAEFEPLPHIAAPPPPDFGGTEFD